MTSNNNQEENGKSSFDLAVVGGQKQSTADSSIRIDFFKPLIHMSYGGLDHALGITAIADYKPIGNKTLVYKITTFYTNYPPGRHGGEAIHSVNEILHNASYIEQFLRCWIRENYPDIVFDKNEIPTDQVWK